MQSVLLHPLARELRKLYLEGHDERNPGTRFLNILAWDYRPEEMSDTESQTVWTGVVLLSLQYGVTIDDYVKELGVTLMQLQQWMNGVSQPHRVSLRKDLYRAITDLVKIKQSTA